MHLRAGIRASDAEREEAVTALGRHFAEGRLSARELELRATHAYSARGRGDLARLLADLPAIHRRTWSREALARSAGRFHRFLLRGHAATFAGVNGFLIAAWALTGGGPFWPALYLAPSTALLAWHWAGGRMVARAFARSSPRSRPG